MKQLKSSRWFFVIIIAAFIFTIFAVFYIRATRTISEGDKELLLKPSLALEKYELAQKQWLLLRYDKDVQLRIEKTKEEIQRRKNEPVIIIFFKDKTLDTDINSLIQEIETIEGVRQTRFISKEEAFKKYKEVNKDTTPELTNLVTLDILPASLEVYLDEFSLKDQIREIAESKMFVGQVAQPSIGW